MAELQGIQPSLWKEVIPFFQGDCDIELTPESGRCTREYLVPWELRQQFAQQTLGYPYIVSIGQGLVEMRRHLPETVEYLLDDGDLGYMHANRLKFKGLGGGGEVTAISIDGLGNVTFGAGADFSNLNSPRGQIYRSWEWAQFSVEYVTQLYDVLSLEQIENLHSPTGHPNGTFDCKEIFRYVVRNDDARTQMGITEHGNWVFEGTGVPAGNKVGVPIPSGEATFTWFDVHPAGYSVSNIMDRQGKWNQVEFMGYPIDTVVLDSFKRRWRRSPFGERTINIEFKLLLRPKGANMFADGQGVFRKVVHKNDATISPLYPDDLLAIFHANPI